MARGDTAKYKPMLNTRAENVLCYLAALGGTHGFNLRNRESLAEVRIRLGALIRQDRASRFQGADNILIKLWELGKPLKPFPS